MRDFLIKWIATSVILMACTLLDANAKVIQILHTNDLHSALKTSGAPARGQIEMGGWAQLKTVMDRLTLEAKEKGMETLKLDAGDFFEGTALYFPEQGVPILKAFQSIGYDAAALGNHDWMQGARMLNNTFGKAPFPFPLLSANIQISPALKHLNRQIIPSTQIVKDGIKIGIVGLSTHEAFYKWITRVGSKRRDMKIYKTGYAAQYEVDEIRDNNDVVIALTHIGVREDRKLAAATYGLDLIVGGHSHTKLDAIDVVEDPEGRPIPIVQAGFNGAQIGKILLEVNPGQPPKLLSYELVPIFHHEKPDPTVASLIATAEEKLYQLYTPEVLNEKLGTSEVRLISGEAGPTGFSIFAAEAMRKATDADITIDVGAFHGNTPLPKGDVTRLSLMEMYPRKFEVQQNEGWYVYRSWVPGWVLKLGIKYAVEYGYYVTSAGLTYDVVELDEGKALNRIETLQKNGLLTRVTPYRAINLKINGERICTFCKYSVASSEGLIRGAYAISPFIKLLIRWGRSTGVTIWNALSTHLKEVGVIKAANDDELHDDIRQTMRPSWVREEALDHSDAVIQQFMRDILKREKSGDVIIEDDQH